jgi:dsDNA-binding SOS-regulon protein
VGAVFPLPAEFLILIFNVSSSVSNRFVELRLERMADKKIKGTDSSRIISSTKYLQSSVGPKLIEGTNEDDSGGPKLIEGTNEDDLNNLQKTVSHSANFVASMQQEHPISLVLAENKSNLQEILVEQKIPTGVSINLSPKMDSSEVPCKAYSSEVDDPNTMKSNTSSCMFEASKQQECPISLILLDKKRDLQEVYVEQNVPCGDYVALSPKADSRELTSANEVPDGFLTFSRKAYESKEAQDDYITLEASE